MKIGRVIGGLILIAVAIWAFVSLTNPTAKYLGGAILAILGLVLLIPGLGSEKKEVKEEVKKK